MQVQIHNKTFEYTSDFYTASDWKRQNDPHAFFKYPVVLGDTRLFIKRFERKPRAFTLLEKAKGQPMNFLPDVFDFQKTTEMINDQDQEIYYLFEEYIPGIRLNEAIIGKGVDIDFRQMAEDLWESLDELHEHDIWHTDFCEENIIISEDHRYCLIDFDSGDIASHPLDLKYVVFKEYNAIVLSVLKEMDNSFTIQNITGKNLNMLELLFMLSYYKSIALGEISYQSLGQKQTIEQIKRNIPDFENVLKKALQTKLTWPYFEQLLNHWFGTSSAIGYLSNTTPLKENLTTVPDTISEIPATSPSPHQFNISIPTIELTINGQNISSFTGLKKDIAQLSWNINNTTKIEAGLIGKAEQKYEKVNFITAFGELDFELLRSETLVIEAINESADGQQRITRREIDFVVSIPELKVPEILSFEIDSSNTRKSYVKAMQPFTLSWNTRNATIIRLNGIEYDTNLQNTITLQTQENTSYELVAINRNETQEKQSSPESIIVKVRKTEVAQKKILSTSVTTDTHTATINPTYEESPVIVVATPSLEYLHINGADQQMVSLEKNSVVEISWKFNHLSSITINSETYPAEGSFKITLSENLTYFFRAADIYETLIISVIEPKTLALPKINEFSVNASSDAQMAVKTGQAITLKWQVAHASKVRLFKNQEEVTLTNQSAGQINLEQLLKGSKNKSVNLLLKAENQDGKVITQSKQLTIEAKSKLSLFLIIAIILGIIMLIASLVILLS